MKIKIKPKYVDTEEVVIKLTFKSRKILEHYSDYTGLTQSQLLEELLPHLLEDEDFINYVESKRSNIRMKRELGLFNG
jgi:hypothetical protein